MGLDHFFDLRVVESLADLVNLDFDEFGGIVILILGRHPLSFLELSDMKAKVSHPVNVFFDFLSIVKALLKHSFLFDLFKDPKLGHDFRVHTATFKIGRLGNLRRSLSLLTARLIGHGSDWGGWHLVLKVVRSYTVKSDETDLVENVEVVQMTLMEYQFQEKSWGVNVD
jgi:hypothetical protein